MLLRFAAFEFRYQLFSPLFIITAVMFFLVSFAILSVPQAVQMLSGSANVNSPYVVSLIALAMCMYGVFIPTAFLSSVVLRDRQMNTEPVFFTLPVREFDYLAGRFLGAFAVCVLLFAVVPLGELVASLMPWLENARRGPLRPLDYVFAWLVLGAPNMLITGALMFTVANVTRSSLATYTALVAFVALNITGGTLASEPAFRTAVAMLDPFGANAFTEATRYWSPSEMNTRLVPFDGIFLWNRLLWLGVAAGLLAFNVAAFSFRKRGIPALQRKKRLQSVEPAQAHDIRLPRTTPSFGARATWSQFLRRTAFEVRGMLRSVSFWVLLVIGVLMVLVALFNLGLVYGTPVYPVSRVMAEIAGGQFSLVPLIVVIYFASELVWRERSQRAHEIIDATPTPSWVFLVSKLLAMWLVIFAMTFVGMLTAMIVQALRGFGGEIDIGLYAMEMLILGPVGFYMLATLSLFVQVLANNRYLGMLIMVGYLIARTALANFGFSHNLYMFSGAPGAPYSDLNGYGHFLEGRLWFNLYWALFCAMLAVLTFLLWNRGALTPVWRRAKALPRRMRSPAGTAMAVLLAAFVLTGGFIFYNTNILNEYRTQRQAQRLAVTYERTYRQYEDLPQPRIAATTIAIDIFPRERRYEARGVYRLENATDAPIPAVHTSYALSTEILEHALEGATLTEADEDYGYYIWTLDTPLQPGESRELRFTVARQNPGFRNGNNSSSVVWNGSFINGIEAMPVIGFNTRQMLQDRRARRRAGLEPIDRLPPLEDDAAAQRNYIARDADWMEFEATVSTDPDQVAIAPGTLQREWEEGGRRYFHYVMETPILNFYSFLSARYEVAEDRRNGVLLQVFHDEQHGYNVLRMLQAMGDAIDYYSAAFSPYQHEQMRIFEFPVFHGTFAQAFPNSAPYSEGAGFIADNRDTKRVDYVYYITAHEVAHQWWAHQLIGGNMQGATMLSETFSQYSSLMVMKQEYGDDQIRRFLKYELDQYLAGRGTEAIGELPLYRVENQQYIHYNKGSLVMYALQDYVGEAVVNRALSRFLREYSYRSDPYPRSTDFIRILREEAGPQYDGLITDLFEKIVLFDLKATGLEVTERADGRFDVRLTVEARKLEADEEGAETEVPLDYSIDIGLFMQHPDEAAEGDDHVLLLEKRRILDGVNVFEFVTDTAPEVGGIDPYNKLIDRVSGDNLRSVEEPDATGAEEAEPTAGRAAAGRAL